MAKPDLYICHTAYHVLIALVRALRAGGGQAAVQRFERGLAGARPLCRRRISPRLQLDLFGRQRQPPLQAAQLPAGLPGLPGARAPRAVDAQKKVLLFTALGRQKPKHLLRHSRVLLVCPVF